MDRPAGLAPSDIVRVPVPGMSIDTLLAKHEKFTKAWKASDAHRELHDFFNNVLLNINTFQIKSCMCLCLGSITAAWAHVEGWVNPGVNSLSQLVALESWIELLSEFFTLFTSSDIYQEQGTDRAPPPFAHLQN